jgi:hypothetical protein
MKPFPKSPQKVVTVVIDEHGNLEYLKTDSCDVLLELGEVITRRASHVEPATFWTRVWFHIIRTLVSDKSRVAAWTRNWKCLWRVNTAPVGGPILRHIHVDPNSKQWAWDVIAVWENRQDAIDAEITFLNKWFLTR